MAMTDYSYETFQNVNPYLSMMIFAILMLSFLALYFLPSIVAMMRQHPQKWLIAGLNVFAGWTGLFWIGLLIWSLWPKDKLSDIGGTMAASAPGQGWGPSQAHGSSGSFGGPAQQTRPEETLAQLASMKDRGILTEDEFAKAKAKLISRL